MVHGDPQLIRVTKANYSVTNTNDQCCPKLLFKQQTLNYSSTHMSIKNVHITEHF